MVCVLQAKAGQGFRFFQDGSGHDEHSPTKKLATLSQIRQGDDPAKPGGILANISGVGDDDKARCSCSSDGIRMQPKGSVQVGRTLLCVMLLTVFVGSAEAQRRPVPAGIQQRYVLPIQREFQVRGETRTAMVFIPKSSLTQAAPVVFCFHGSGGSPQKAMQQFKAHRHWEEAIVVYPAGLEVFRRGESKPGWETELDEDGKNRELEFFDEMLKVIKDETQVDDDRVFAAGYSNGGFLCYLLWRERGDVLAALAPTACFSRVDLEGAAPKPILHAAGRNDRLVPLDSQLSTIQRVKEINASAEGRPGKRRGVRIFPSEKGAPLMLYVHPGGHAFPENLDEMIVQFFQNRSETPLAAE